MSIAPRLKGKLDFFFRAEILIAAACLIVVGMMLFTFFSKQGHPFVSVEVKFTDASAHGLAIMPASCPSDPHYAGHCDVPPSCDIPWLAALFGIDCSPPPDPVICPAGYTMDAYGRCTTPPITSCPTGYVYQNGQCVPSVSDCPIGYTLQGSLCVVTSCPSGYVLSGAQCVLVNNCSATYQCSGNDLYYLNASCQSALVQTCSWGCSGGACLPPPPPSYVSFGATNSKGNFSATGHVQVKPSLLRNGDTTQVYWNVANASGCTVTGDNGDSWSGASSGAAGQTSKPIVGLTRFTLSCASLPGATPPSVSESTTVKVIPSFQEI